MGNFSRHIKILEDFQEMGVHPSNGFKLIDVRIASLSRKFIMGSENISDEELSKAEDCVRKLKELYGDNKANKRNYQKELVQKAIRLYKNK